MNTDADFVQVGNLLIPKHMAGKSLKICVPFPPSVNHYWGKRVIAGKGRKPFISEYLTAKAKEYREEVNAIVATRWNKRPLKPIKRRVILHIGFVAPDRRIRDLDNFRKAIYDALTHAGFWEDDSQVDLDIAERYAVEKPGRLELTIMEKLEPCYQKGSLFEQEKRTLSPLQRPGPNAGNPKTQ